LGFKLLQKYTFFIVLSAFNLIKKLKYVVKTLKYTQNFPFVRRKFHFNDKKTSQIGLCTHSSSLIIKPSVKSLKVIVKALKAGECLFFSLNTNGIIASKFKN